jgi:hypothetical protein
MRKYTLLALVAGLLALAPMSGAAGNDALYKSLGGKKATAAVAVTVENEAGADQPTTTPLIVASLDSAAGR